MDENIHELTITLPEIDRNVSEALRSIRTSLLYTGVTKVIAVTSSIPDEGKTVVSVQLASQFASLGKRVLLVDCDLRKPKIKRMLGVKGSVTGLSECLSSQADFSIYSTNVDHLYVLLSGKIPPNSSELLSNGKLEKMLKVLKERFDYIIIDTPPAVGAVDIQIIGSMVDGILLVIRSNYVKMSVVRNVVKQLERNNIRIIGAILNGVKKTDKDYYYYYYYEY
ncbi:MAG: CpsD/CapB family tyrosine-protein kinase [Erysipelotrichaceae bacterium]|nr:CpsD/CapB family tyrosine-protein kinase [Erysipelotrichaceae bacterium]